MAAVLFSLAACWGLPGESRSPGSEQALQSNLSVASAALAAGQPAVAQRLYMALSERFEDAPEPALGLGYVALRGNNPGEAKDHFLRAASLADDAPGMKAEALLGAARASLAQGDSRTARRHLTVARDLARDPSSIAWIENGLAVAAVFEEDFGTAETHYVSALRQPSAHPRIAANYVRMLIASERVEEAERTFGAFAASWLDESDRQALQGLIDEARRSSPVPDRIDPRLVLRLAKFVPGPARTDEPYGGEVLRALYRPDALSHGLVLLAGSRSIPLEGPETAGNPVQADLPFLERATQEAADPAPVPAGTSPESLRAVPEREPAPEPPPSLRTAGSEADYPAARTFSVPPALPDMLTLRIGSGIAGSRLAPDAVQEPAADADMGHGGIALETGGHGLRLLPAAGSPHALESSESARPDPVAAPAPEERPLGAEAAPAGGSSPPGGETWAHYLGPDTALSADVLLLSAASRYSSRLKLAYSELPSSPVSLGPKPGAATAAHAVAIAATTEPVPRADAAHAIQPHLPRTEDETRHGLSEPVPLRAANVSNPNDRPNHDPFSAPRNTFKPVLLASASPRLDDFLWQPEWIRRAEGTDDRHTTMVAVDGGGDPPVQTAEAGTGARAPGSQWTVLLGTGQRLSLGVDASAVAIASPEIADVQLLSPRVLFVMGRSTGRTTVTVLGEDGSVFEQDVTVVLDLEPLRQLLADEPGLQAVRVDGLARGVSLAGEVGSQESADRALGLAEASLPEGVPVENNLDVELDLEPLRTLLAGEPGLEGVEARKVARGVALSGEVESTEAAERAARLAVASLPEGLLVENNLRVVFDLEPLRGALAGEPGFDRVQVKRLARGVALAGEVDTPEMADRAVRVAVASLPDGLLVENNLSLKLDLTALGAVIAGEPGLQDVKVQRIGRGVALTGEVAWAEAAERAGRLAAASLPEGTSVENNLRIVFDLAPLQAVLAAEPGLEGVELKRLARGVALTGNVASAEAADRALRLAAASLPDGLLVENGLDVELDLLPLRAALAGEPGLHRVRARRLARGVALTGEVDSPELADRAVRMAAASLPEGIPVESNLNLRLDLSPLRTLIAGEPDLEGVEVQPDGDGVALTGEVSSAEAADRAYRLAVSTLPAGAPVENGVRVAFDVAPLRAALAGEPGLDRVHVRRLPRSVVLSGDVDSPEAESRALQLAAASIPDGVPVENELHVGPDLESLRALLEGEPGLAEVEVQRIGRGVALAGEVAWVEAAERANRLAAISLPEGTPLENNLRVVFDTEPLLSAIAGQPGLDRVRVQRLARGVALHGDVDSPDAADRARRLAAASLPEGLLVESNLTVVHDLAPLRALLARERGLQGIRVQRVERGAALTGEVSSPEAAERAHRLAVGALPEGTEVENGIRVVFELAPLRAVLAGEPGLDRVTVQRLARGVALAGEVDSPADADRALRLAAASLPEGLLVENNLGVGLDLEPLRALLAGEPGSQDLSPLGTFIAGQPGLEGVAVQWVGRGVALTGEVATAEAADRAYRLAVASLPETVPVENNLRVLFDIEPLRTVLAAEPGLERVQVQRLARGVALAGEVASHAAAERALRLAAASLPEGLLVENNLSPGLELGPLLALMTGEPGLENVAVRRVGRGVALTGEVASAEAADRAHRLAVASLPESVPVENNLRVLFDVEPLRTVLATEPGLERVQVQRLARGVALAGEVDSHAAAERAIRLSTASLPEGLLVESNLRVVLDLAPLRALMAGEPGLESVVPKRVGRGVALTGEVATAEAADRAHRLAVAALPESLPVENNLRVVFDIELLGAVLAGEPELAGVRVRRLAGGVVLTGEVASAEAADRAKRIASASLPESVPVESSVRVVLDMEPLRAALVLEPGLDRVQVHRLARGIALSGDVDSPVAEDRALRLASASLPEGVPVENNLNVGLDLGPLVSVIAGESDLASVRVERTGRGVALIGEVGSAAASEQAVRLATALLPEGVPVQNSLRVVLDIAPLRALIAGAPELGRVEVQRLARGVALTGDVDSHAAADLAFRLATASLPEGMLVESSLNVRLDLAPLRVLLAGDAGLRNVRVKRVGRGVALTGEVGSAEASDRAARLAAASLPEGVAVENNLRVAPDVEPLRVLLAGESGLERVQVQKLVRGVALAGDVASPQAADRALRLAAASLPEGMLVENNLSVGLDLAPLRALMAAEVGFESILVKRIDRGVALTGEVASQVDAERATRLAAATLPETALVENNLRMVLDTGPLRAALGADPEFDRIHVRELAHGVSLSGEVSSAAAVDRAHRLAAVSLPPDTKVENELRIAGPLQVNLEVQIAEVQRSIAEDFGFNWELFGRSAEGDLGGGFRVGRTLPLPPPLGDIGGPGAIPPSVVDGLTSPSLLLSQTWEEIGITGMVEALAKAGLANVLARPNVTANSGEVASFFSGGEFPLPSGFKDGVIVFEYKKYGVVLDFVPTIMDEGRIELTVRPEVSEPSRDNSVQVTQGIDVPVINVRRAETTVAMGDGESIVIAGLFSSASNEVQSGVPVLKDLPLVGGMFGHTSTRADELELIVTVTARLVQAGPAPDEALAAGSGQTGNSYYY